MKLSFNKLTAKHGALGLGKWEIFTHFYTKRKIFEKYLELMSYHHHKPVHVIFIFLCL